MNLLDLLTYLHNGAPTTWTTLIHLLDNPTLKSLRLIHRPLAPHLFPFLFTRLYISAHDIDLQVLRTIATHPSDARKHVTELIWDDTRFDQWVSGYQTYTDRLLSTTTTPSHIVKREGDVIAEAYRFWASEAASFAENRQEGVDQRAFEECVLHFLNLRSIIILSRSRLTYVDPEAYWALWQTPRTRVWRRKSFHRYLLQPEPFKPSTGTTVSQSEGIRPMQIVRGMARRDSRFKVGHLSINSIGGGQTRVSGNMVNSNRFERKWHIDLQELTSRCPPTAKGTVALQLFLETQTEDIFRSSGVLEDNLDLLMMDTARSLEGLSISNICLDWFMDYSTLANTQFPYLRRLRRVRIEGGSSDDPISLLHFLARQTTVREVLIDGLHLETTTWSEVLHNLKDNKITFDKFEIQPSRAKWQLFPRSETLGWEPPRIIFSDRIVPWLKNEAEIFPLSFS